MDKGKYSGKMLIGSILAGIIYAVMGEVIYRTLQPQMHGVTLIAIYFMGLFLFIGLAVWGIGKTVYSRFYRAVDMKQWMRICMLMLLCTAVFEFLYEVQFEEKAEPSNAYVFVLDNSGSMEESDPQGMRYEAVEKLLSEKPDDFRYAVYTFSDNVQQVRGMERKDAGVFYEHGENNGGTAILETLRTILSDINDGTLELNSDRTHVILLTDGYATDIHLFNKYKCISALKEYTKQNITISTVGLLNADQELMSLIATKTGGVFINVENINDLDEAVKQAGKTGDDKWNLLSYRNNLKADLLYVVMRILFVTALGILIAFQKAVICEKFLDTSAVIHSSLFGSILAGIGIEVGMNGLGIHPTVMRIAACVLISFTLLKCDLERIQGADTAVYRGIGI